MQDRIGALEAALTTSALNERAILDAWGGDPLNQLLENLEAQRSVRALCLKCQFRLSWCCL
jgi:muramoyltetrapeptide carboxypeptidase LdcA involved in peptidoglycan recycling